MTEDKAHLNLNGGKQNKVIIMTKHMPQLLPAWCLILAVINK